MTDEPTETAPFLREVSMTFDAPKGHETVTDRESGLTVKAYGVEVTAWRNPISGWMRYARAHGPQIKKDGTLSEHTRTVVFRQDSIDAAPAWIRAAWVSAHHYGPTR